MIKWPKPKRTKNKSRSLSQKQNSTLHITLPSPHSKKNKNTIELSSLSPYMNSKQHKKTINVFGPNTHEKQRKSNSKIIKTKSQNKNNSKMNASSSRTNKTQNNEKKIENEQQNKSVDKEEREISQTFMNTVSKLFEVMVHTEDSVKFMPETVVYFLGGALQNIRLGLSFDEFSKECVKIYIKSSQSDVDEFVSIAEAHFARLEKKKERRNKANLDEIIKISTPEKYEKKEVTVSSGIKNENFEYQNLRFKTRSPENKELSEEPFDQYQENNKNTEKTENRSQIKVEDSIKCYEAENEIQNLNTLRLKNSEFATPVLSPRSSKISNNNTHEKYKQNNLNENKLSCMVRTVKSISVTPLKGKQENNDYERGSNVQYNQQASYRKTSKRNFLESPPIFSSIESVPDIIKSKDNNCGEKPLTKIDEINKAVEKCINLSKMDTELFGEKRSVEISRREFRDSSLIFQNINDKLTSIHQTLNDISPLKQMNRTCSLTKRNDLLRSRVLNNPSPKFSPNSTCENPKTVLENLLPKLHNANKYALSSEAFALQNNGNDRIDEIADRLNEQIRKNCDKIEQWKGSRRIY